MKSNQILKAAGNVLLVALASLTLAWSAMAQDPGTVEAWGRNGGQLGDGTFTERRTPVPVVGLTQVTAISSGSLHSLALLSDGTVMAWGTNQDGQLGDGTFDGRNTAVQVSGLTNVVAVSAGGFHSLALLADGTVMSWGNNEDGQLGDGTQGRPGRNAPAPVSSLANAIAVAAGSAQSFALLSDGTVMAWGYNGFGQLGVGFTHEDTRLPTHIPDLANVTAVASGGEHALALLADGTVMSWGTNDFGQLGDGTFDDRFSPVPVRGLSNVTAIACGGQPGVALNSFSLALIGDSTIMAWGGGAGFPTATPVPVTGLTNAIAIASGGFHNLALLSDGTIAAWGGGILGGTDIIPGTGAVRVSGITNAVGISAGEEFSLALF